MKSEYFTVKYMNEYDIVKLVNKSKITWALVIQKHKIMALFMKNSRFRFKTCGMK